MRPCLPSILAGRGTGVAHSVEARWTPRLARPVAHLCRPALPPQLKTFLLVLLTQLRLSLGPSLSDPADVEASQVGGSVGAAA